MIDLNERMILLSENCSGNKQLQEMSTLAHTLSNDLRDYDIIRKIVIAKNDLLNGCIELYITTMPESIVMKLWYNSNMYYLSFFKKSDDFFDVQLKETFNASGIMPAHTIEEAEERILDFLANEVFNRDTKVVLT